MIKEITDEDAKKVSLHMGANNLPDVMLIALGKQWYKATHTNSESSLIPTPRQAIKAYKYLIGIGYRHIEPYK